MKFTHIALATAMTATAGIANAETFFTDNSLTVLYGTDYKVGDSDKAVVTFEHFSAHSWGDIFVFGDRLMDQSDDNERNGLLGTETYIEVAPRFKVSGFDAGIVKNLYVATQWEMSTTADNLLIGLGTDFNVPGFQNLSINAYQRLNDNQENNYQTTAVWGVPFAIAGQNFMFDGFWDWSTGTETYAASSNFTYQLKWDAAQVIGTDNKVYVGIEHAIWNNKYNLKDGIDFGNGPIDTNENVVSALVKVHF
jgi:nucleoside-specific outer membrane channel protein Tsx